jgi:hypothetical protein
MQKFFKVVIWFSFVVFLVSACYAVIPQEVDSMEYTPENNQKNHPSPPAYNIPGWNQLLSFDAIRPVYDPHFISPEDANLQEDELIMGVAWDGEAKAYPVSVLRSREMVNDEMAGVPYLVSW